jgi:hypothetical protein
MKQAIILQRPPIPSITRFNVFAKSSTTVSLITVVSVEIRVSKAPVLVASKKVIGWCIICTISPTYGFFVSEVHTTLNNFERRF